MVSLSIISCTDRIEEEEAAPRQLIIEASIPSEAVKAGFNGDNATHVYWKAGDALRVFNHSNPANNTVTNHSFITTAGSIPKRIDSWGYSYYHHGRKTSAANLSALVQMGDSIGGSWSSDIWDFSGDYPTLK